MVARNVGLLCVRAVCGNVYGSLIEQIMLTKFYMRKRRKEDQVMAIRIYGVINAENNETVMTLQGKQKRVVEKAVADYIQCGRLPSGEYRVELITTERT